MELAHLALGLGGASRVVDHEVGEPALLLDGHLGAHAALGLVARAAVAVELALDLLLGARVDEDHRLDPGAALAGHLEEEGNVEDHEGRSGVARLFEKLGAVVIDADAITHELQSRGSPLLERIVAACLRHGVAPGIATGSGESARARLEAGFTWVAVSGDIDFLARHAREELAAAGREPSAPGAAEGLVHVAL